MNGLFAIPAYAHLNVAGIIGNATTTGVEHGDSQEILVSLGVFEFNGTYKITASLRKQDPADPHHTLLAGFSNDENSCLFSINEDAKGTDYALLKYDAVDLRRS